MTILLVREVLGPDIVVFSTLILLLLGRVIDLSEAFSGFSNHGMLTVAFLFIVAAALQRSEMLNSIAVKILKPDGRTPAKLLRLMLPVSAISAFFNNTPIVAMMIPVLRQWTRKTGRPVSKFMLPLSYASILGGICTLIGTSTTLVVHGLMIENGMKGFSFFEISRVGVPTALMGLLLISLIGYRLLPDRRTPLVELGKNTREFVVEMKVGKGFSYTGRSISEAGLRHLKGLYLFQIEREDKMLPVVGPDEIIYLGDRLFFVGLPSTLIELQKTPGLVAVEDPEFDLRNYDSDQLGTFEAVVSSNSPLIGKNVRDSDFRSRYRAVILGIHRSGERIRQKVGDIVIKSGDTLLILAGNSFAERWYHSKDFYLVSRAEAPPSKPRRYSLLSMSILAAMISVMAAGLLPILLAVCLAVLLLIISGCISPEDARDSIDWKVLLIIASSFGISRAMINSGVADYIAVTLISALGRVGPLGLIAGTYLIGSLYTEMITNNAAAALVFPVALTVASQAGLDPQPFLIALAIAASASFATPIGYQTNLMVYGPGGYRFSDYLRIGIPLNIIIGIIAVTLIYLLYF
ncbi:MAG: SLC13 family permease [Candidatus Latescibacteria bacterium]|nr:SLC13 family permease [bacterium]MBD3424681.1 SLC13 family permease [Candidatus Latescibacterota bacterium]